jgi:glycosyltransferase involved in cell wall biosynthesis
MNGLNHHDPRDAAPQDGRRLRSPLVTVITVCFNAEAGIERTVKSVLAQTYSPIEYIIIDGASSDSTMEIVNRFRRDLAAVVSEPDDGISDAFNKGISLGTGELVQLLNADDEMPPNKITESVRALSEKPHAGFAFGDLSLVGQNGQDVLVIEGDPQYRRVVARHMPRINHPTVLARASVYLEHGGFESQWRIGMDYEWLLRVTKAGVVGVYSPDVHVFMRVGGVSEANPVQCMNEERLISIAHGRAVILANSHFLLRTLKLWLRLALERVLPARAIAAFRPGKTVAANVVDTRR